MKKVEAIEAILSRRSIRKYTNQVVSKELLDQLLHAAMSAPSAGNQQAWQFIVVNKREKLDCICDVHPYAHSLQSAGSAIIVCGDLSLEKHKDFWIQDCSAATQNILVAAKALGLSTVWLGVYPRIERVEGLQKLFSLPDSVIPLSIIPIGFSEEVSFPVNRYDKRKIHLNSW